MTMNSLAFDPGKATKIASISIVVILVARYRDKSKLFNLIFIFKIFQLDIIKNKHQNN